MKTFETVDQYIQNAPEDLRDVLEKIRKTIKKSVPAETKEIISYGMPAYKLNKTLVYFALMKNHFGFYPASSGILNFEKELSSYKHSKGAIQFPITEPVPFDLIEKITKFRVSEDLGKIK